MKSLIVTLVILLQVNICFGAKKYSFKPEKGKVSFTTKGWPNLINIKGEADGFKGVLEETMENKVSGKLSFALDKLKTGIELRDDHMKNKYLEVKTYPVAELTLKELPIPANGDGAFDFKGLLLVHGVTKEVTGKAKIEGIDGHKKMTAEVSIKLPDFNVEIPSYKGITVAEKVDIVVESRVN